MAYTKRLLKKLWDNYEKRKNAQIRSSKKKHAGKEVKLILKHANEGGLA